ncbi:hypothetical protein MLD38_033946 [Melastoma candidum]|uniref:Uncharacterized protein n=1 Tax=Melastoma candidum TaxID=119954 RepID=A0ACB9M8I0_9MYRT|nr:hypothetical protein MLD38_033946 [Melastoma candidum]
MAGLVMVCDSERGRMDFKGSVGDEMYCKELRVDCARRSSPRSPLSPHTPPSDSAILDPEGAAEASIEQLCDNVCDMQSSDRSPSPSGPSFISYGEESRIDSELRHLVGDFGVFQDAEEGVEERKEGDGRIYSDSGEPSPMVENKVPKQRQLKQNPASKVPNGRPPSGKKNEKFSNNPKRVIASKNNKGMDSNADIGPFLLKQAKDMMSSGENPQRALEVALRAMESYEQNSSSKPGLDFVMCLHIVAAIYCHLGQHADSIAVLERSIVIPALEDGESHALAKFAGCMQLGDAYVTLGQTENSILCYTAGLEIQKQVLGENDPRVGETCRYLAEAHVQALQLDEAGKLCQMALDIHRESGQLSSLEEAADRRLMGLVHDLRGEYECALEHYVLANLAMSSSTGQELGVATVDCSIGDSYLSLARYDEAISSFQKAVTTFKAIKGENHPEVASVYVRLADLYYKIGKFRESRSFCEKAQKIYIKPHPRVSLEVIASGLTDVSAIYQSMNELSPALKLLKRALRLYRDAQGNQCMVAGIEAQIGAIYYMMGSYTESHKSLEGAISVFRVSGEKRTASFGICLNQMGLTCIQLYEIKAAAELFEEAREILELENGPYHPDTLGVYSNLAGVYDALGRLDDAINVLEYVVGMREEKLGTANPDVDEERRRLGILLKEAGKVRAKKSRPLETFLENTTQLTEDENPATL